MGQKDMFGRYLPYQSPSIEGYEENIKGIINTIADNILAQLSLEEALRNLNDYNAIQTFIVNAVNTTLNGMNLNVKVDGKNIAPILKGIIQERKNILLSSLSQSITGE